MCSSHLTYRGPRSKSYDIKVVDPKGRMEETMREMLPDSSVPRRELSMECVDVEPGCKKNCEETACCLVGNISSTPAANPQSLSQIQVWKNQCL